MYQMVYASAATQEFSPTELSELLRIARENNTALGVCGLLLYHDGSFIQALEGEQSVVEALFEKISRDSRHSDCLVLFRDEVDDPAFADWSMGFAQASGGDLPEGFHHFLQRGFRRKMDNDAHVARRAMLAFRDGRWRQRVETGKADAA